MTVHFLKTWPKFFADAKVGTKEFEVRPDDRTPPYLEGDVVVLREWAHDPVDNTDSYAETGWLVFSVGYVYRGAPMPVGTCAFALRKASAKDKRAAVDASMNGTVSK